jgi:hypothetical protein
MVLDKRAEASGDKLVKIAGHGVFRCHMVMLPPL